MHDVEHLSIYIERSPGDIYEFVSDPRNLPRWAQGLAQSEVEKVGDVWTVKAPFGKAKIRFVDHNPFGVLDHDVELESSVVLLS